MKALLQTLTCIAAIICLSFAANGQAPVADFSATPITGCSPIVTQFTDLSTNNPSSWSWDLGNGTLSTVQNPSTVYITPGTYTVTLTVTNSNGTNTKVMTNYVTVTPSPAVQFTAVDSSFGCGSKTVQFVNNTILNSAGPGTYFWDFGDGTTSTAASPTHTYTAIGNYTVLLVATNSVGCSKSIQKTSFVKVLPVPNASFTAINNNSCTLPLTVSFNNTSTGSATYEWFFGDGGTSTATSPTHVYTAIGSYDVMLVATSTGGCKDTLLSPGTVNIGSLTAGFIPSATNACTGNAIAFTNTSVPGAGNSYWYFGDGNTSSLSNPVYIYTTPGTYNVLLVVNYNNCSDSATSTVTIAPGPSTSFIASPTVGCNLPFTTQFTNNTTGAVSYDWDFGDGTTSTAPNPSHTYNAYGNYTVRLVSTSANGCKDTMVLPSYIKLTQNPCTVASSQSSGCVPLTTNMSMNCAAGYNISSYSWDFGDGGTSTSPNPSHTYTTAGTFTGSVTYVSNGCTRTASFTIVAQPKPNAAFSGSPLVVCPNTPVNFTNASTGATGYQWFFGDGSSSTQINPSHQYSVPGIYSITLVATNGSCSDTLLIPDMVNVNLPMAQFNTSYSCTNRRQWTFNNISVGNTTNSWDFGDGSPSSTALSPTHTYAANGTYTVTLTITNSTSGCSNTYIAIINVFDLNPQFNTLDSTICTGQVAQFYGVSQPGMLYNYHYGAVPATTSTSPNAAAIYASAGIFTVKLIVIDAQGCKDSLVKYNHMRVGSATPAFIGTPLSGCDPLPVSFTDQSIASPAFPITTRSWVFGDNTANGTGTSVNHVYQNVGSYSVELIVTDANGCVSSLVKPAYVNVITPVAQFTSPDTLACSGGSINFINTSTPSSGLSYDWDFGDGGTSTAANPSHIYAATGSYSVRLIVSNASGCKDTLIHPAYITVSNLHASFTMSDSVANCPPLGVNFTNTSTGATSYLWDFSNNTTSVLANPTTIFGAPGTYIVKLKAFTGGGCADSAMKTVSINGGPSGTFSYTPIQGCVSLPVTFTANAINTTSYTWDFHNGVTQTTTSPTFTYTYNTSGFFLPKLVLSNGPNCNTSLFGSDTVKINKATAGFTATPNPVCAGTPVQFTDTSSAATSGISTRSWAFGDGGTSTAINPTYTYSTAGIFTVRLIVGTPNGCLDTVYKTITVNALPVVTATNQTICAGASTQLQANGAASYNWSPATGLSCTTCPDPIATPPATTTYTITGTTALGCVATGQVTVTVNPLPTVSAGAPQSICNGGSVTLQGTGATGYLWSPGTGLSCTTCPTPVANPTTTTTYTLTGTSSAGCTATAQVTVSVGTVPTVSAGSNVAICNGGSTVLTGTGAANYTWSPATGLSCTNCANPVASPTTTTTYTVTGTASNGCTNTAQVTVTVNPLPTVGAGSNTAICAGASTTLAATGANSYTWSPATGLSCINCANPTATPAATTIYTVTGTSPAGCTNTAQVTVTVNPLPTVSAGPDQAICVGSTATLQATGGASYTWSPSTGLSCTTCPNPTATPTATTTYVVTGLSASGCSDTGLVTVVVNPLPVVSAGANQFICPGGSTTLQATGATTYSWSPATGLSCTTCASPIASPSATTTYTVTGTTNGCSATSQVTVNITTQPVITVTGNTSVCAGDTTSLTANGATTYVWSPATGLSCTTCANPTVTPAATTTYTITGTSGIGCIGVTTVTVTVNPIPTVSATAIPAVICPGTPSTLQATGAVTYTWSPSTGLSCTTCPAPAAAPTSTTTYIVTGTTSAGCSDTGMVTLTVSPVPTVTVTPNQSICPGGSTSLQADGAVTYSWTPSTGLSCTTCANPTASPATTTTYIVTGTNSNGCTDTAQVTVSVNAQPTITITGNNAICIGDSTSLQAAGANSYSWTPTTGLSCSTCANPTAAPATTTTYTITGTSGVGCTATTQYTVTVNPLPTVSASANPAVVCPGGSSTLLGSGAVSYTWSPSTGLSCSNCISPIATPSATTTYIVTGTNSNGCADTGIVTVVVSPVPTVTVNPNQSICPGGSTSLQADGAVTYSWTPSTGLSCTTCANPTASPATTTTYVVTGTNANGCTDTAQVTVSVNAQPTITVTGNNAICEGGSTALQASGANSFTWTPSAGLSCTTCANPTASPAATTTYTVTGTSGVGCTGTTQFTVTVNPNPVVNATTATPAICPGSSATLVASGAATYSWTPSAGLSCSNCVSPVATPSATTTYIVTGTTAFGCTDTGKVTITLLPTPTVAATATNNGACLGTPIQLQATGGVSYTWSPSTGLSCTSCPNPTASVGATTTYIVTGTGTNGCTDTGLVTVNVSLPPVVNAGADQAICAGTSANLAASGAATYVWSPATGLSCTTCTTPVATPAATTTYTVIGTNAAGCHDTDQVTVTIKAIPVVNAGAGQTVCQGVPVTLQATGATTYVWSPATGLSCTTCASPVATPSATTTYTVTGTTNGCSSTSQVTVTIKPLPVVDAGPDVSVCNGNGTQLLATGAASYVWSPSAGLSCTTCPNPVATPATPTTYTVTGTGSNGCVASDAVAVSFYTPPVISAGPDQSICRGQNAQLQATGGVSYTWSPATYLTCTSCTSPTAILPVSDIEYSVIGIDAHGCKDSDVVAITVIQPMPVSVGEGGEICEGESFQLSATGGTGYSWTPAGSLDNPTAANPVATPKSTTTYTVTISQNTCFSDLLQVTVIVHPKPEVSAGPDQKIIAGNSVQIYATGNNVDTYTWTPPAGLNCTDCISPVASPGNTTTYTVIAANQYGCSDTDEVVVYVTCDNNQIWTPNTFTPNGDGENDRFYPHAKGITTLKRFRVYDRWGELIFDRTDMPVNDRSIGWDGTYKNQPLKPDVYVYIINATCTTGDPVEIKGDISLVR